MSDLCGVGCVRARLPASLALPWWGGWAGEGCRQMVEVSGGG